MHRKFGVFKVESGFEGAIAKRLRGAENFGSRDIADNGMLEHLADEGLPNPVA
jgi:hypothetical protein